MHRIIAILIVGLLGTATIAEGEPATPLSVVTQALEQLEQTDDPDALAVLSKVIIGAGMPAHDLLFDGSEKTAKLRAKFRAQLRANRDAALRKKGLVVHEWGSVMMLANHKGAKVGFLANDGSDLPPFVHLWQNQVQPTPMIIRKPILYFYPPGDQKMQVTVQATAAQGGFTQWYPKATRFPFNHPGYQPGKMTNSSIMWSGVTIDPAFAKQIPNVDPDHPWWHIARDVDASPLNANGQAEKFIFYRGVTRNEPTVKVTGNEDVGVYEIHNTRKQAVGNIMLMRVGENGASYRVCRKVDAGAKVKVDFNEMQTFTEADQALAHFRESLETHGLFPKEAAGLTKIWGKFFFSRPGTRLLYVMTEAEANELIRLNITPKPANVTRALIVHVECQTQAMDDRVAELIEKLASTDFKERQAAQTELESIDRFAEVLLRKALKEHPDEEVRLRVEAILDAMKHRD